MTEKEIIKFNGYDIYDECSSDVLMAKVLAKEIRKSLEKKGFSVDKNTLFFDKDMFKISGMFNIKYAGTASCNFMINFEYDSLKDRWSGSEESLLKSVKAVYPEYKDFIKQVKKDLKEAGKYVEPVEEKDIER